MKSSRNATRTCGSSPWPPRRSSSWRTRFPLNRRDAAWRAGELYEDKVKDPARARAAYALVPATSPRYRDAQKKLR